MPQSCYAYRFDRRLRTRRDMGISWKRGTNRKWKDRICIHDGHSHPSERTRETILIWAHNFALNVLRCCRRNVRPYVHFKANTAHDEVKSQISQIILRFFGRGRWLQLKMSPSASWEEFFVAELPRFESAQNASYLDVRAPPTQFLGSGLVTPLVELRNPPVPTCSVAFFNILYVIRINNFI